MRARQREALQVIFHGSRQKFDLRYRYTPLAKNT